MDQKQELIIALLMFIAVGVYILVNPDIKQYGNQIVFLGFGILVAVVIVKAVFELLRNSYWSLRRLLDRMRGKLPH